MGWMTLFSRAAVLPRGPLFYLRSLCSIKKIKKFGHSRASKNKKRIFHILFVFPALTHICYMFRAQGGYMAIWLYGLWSKKGE